MIDCYVQCSRCGAKVSNAVESSIPEGLVVRAFVECVDCVAKQPCPFCGDMDFDLKGLKYHLTNYCEEYQNTETLPYLLG